MRAVLVEDSADILDSLSVALSMQGTEVVSRMSTSAAATEWLEANPGGCDVVVLDLFLAEGSGLDVLKSLPHLAEPPLAIVMSNYATEHLRLQCETLGAARTFDKASEIENMMAWLAALPRVSKRS